MSNVVYVNSEFMSKKECSEFLSIKRKYQWTTDTECLLLFSNKGIIYFFAPGYAEAGAPLGAAELLEAPFG